MSHEGVSEQNIVKIASILAKSYPASKWENIELMCTTDQKNHKSLGDHAFAWEIGRSCTMLIQLCRLGFGFKTLKKMTLFSPRFPITNKKQTTLLDYTHDWWHPITIVILVITTFTLLSLMLASPSTRFTLPSLTLDKNHQHYLRLQLYFVL